ncbi:hypothetical protein K440DRAFT_481632, partial [Wilcoxina mikolae CBS 423.85]
SGRADWAIGYQTRQSVNRGSFLIAIEAKTRQTFSLGEDQLLTYLAILREQRLRANKRNVEVQGFFSDGSRYQFMCIRADGTVQHSQPFEIRLNHSGPGSHLEMVWNFMIAVLKAGMLSTPNATPTK